MTKAAWADCPAGASSFQTGVCEAEAFAGADTSLTLSLQRLNAGLPPAGQAALAKSEAAWALRREQLCEKSAGGLFIDFSCATQLTLARLSALKAQGAAPQFPAAYNGRYTVLGTAMPWLWEAGGLNAAYPYGTQNGTGPTALQLSDLDAAAGQTLVIRYISGTVSQGANGFAADATGITSPYDDGGKGASGALLPSAYIHPYPIHLDELVGAFTDPDGAVVGSPFPVGDGPDLETVPTGATQLQLGINADAPGGNSGSFLVAVTLEPAAGVQGMAEGTHGCAVFGGSAGPACENFPSWTSGLWVPPPGSGMLHVLLVGGGGGGASDIFLQGVGGPGGGSGEVLNARILNPGMPVMITVGQHGSGATAVTLPGATGGESVFGALSANGGVGGQLASGGSSSGSGGFNGGGGGGGGTYQTDFDAGAGGVGGTGGNPGASGQPPNDIEDGFNGTPGGAGAPYPLFDFGRNVFTPGQGGSGGGIGAGGLNTQGLSCAGGGGGGGGGGGLMLNDSGPTAQPAYYKLLHDACGQVGGNGQGGTGYGAGGGGAGGGIAGPAGDGANGIVYIEW